VSPPVPRRPPVAEAPPVWLLPPVVGVVAEPPVGALPPAAVAPPTVLTPPFAGDDGTLSVPPQPWPQSRLAATTKRETRKLLNALADSGRTDMDHPLLTVCATAVALTVGPQDRLRPWLAWLHSRSGAVQVESNESAIARCPNHCPERLGIVMQCRRPALSRQSDPTLDNRSNVLRPARCERRCGARGNFHDLGPFFACVDAGSGQAVEVLYHT
jgi:hypothetical protein